MLPPGARSLVAGGQAQSSTLSGIYNPSSSQLNLNPSLESSANSVSGTGVVSQALNGAGNSGPSIAAANSYATGANSSFSGGPHLQRSASISKETYLQLPASPISFSSNNINAPRSCVIDVSSMIQHNSQQVQNPQQTEQSRQQQQQEGFSSPTSQLESQTGQVSLQMCEQPHDSLPMQKKPRLDIRQDRVLQQQLIQQLLRQQDSVQLQGHNLPLQTLTPQQILLQQRNLQQQQILQSMPTQQASMQQQHLQHLLHPSSGTKRSFDSGICARRLMQYMYHLRQRPQDNNIFYWRKFVDEYFAPCAKKRWCLSLYDTAKHCSLGVFPQAAMLDTWHCDICGSKSGRGFEITADILPRLSAIEFNSGVVDELLFVDKPHEFRFPSGLMMLEYGKAIQESVYEQLRVVREGQLRIMFTPDLKILSWEFCARHHEELFPRKTISTQVKNLVQVAEKYQATINESGSAGVSPENFLTFGDTFLRACSQFPKNLDLQSLNDLGFSKRFVRCLQIAEVVNSMKDLIDFSRKRNIGPIESLKEYPRQATAAKLQALKMREMEQLSNTQEMVAALRNYQNLLRQSSMNTRSNLLQTEASCSFDGPSSSNLPFQGPVSPISGSLPNATVNGLSSLGRQPSHLLQNNQQQSSLANPHLQQNVSPQMLQEMMSKDRGIQQPLSRQNANGNAADDSLTDVNGARSLPSKRAAVVAEVRSKTVCPPNNVASTIPCRTNSFKTVANNSAVASNNGLRPDVMQNPHFAELVQDMPRGFAENGVFDSELGAIDFCWKS
ncbi:hypothetical protein MRB53_025651 [Persea americana]|uniref:Uncharacterized protein n=1 Tax=Persea americana TaxID=3435 RepID=A0ACC2LGD6_PERAE|nr:hypothetical protein MRB53_025651 [Persea americana]